MTSLRRKLANDVAGKIIVFPLEECSLEVNVAKMPSRGSTLLARKAKTRAGGGGRISLLVKPLFILKATQNPTSLALDKCAILVTLEG